VHLLEGTSRILPTYDARLSPVAAASLNRLGVTVHTDSFVTDVRPDGVTVQSGQRTDTISARTLLWQPA